MPRAVISGYYGLGNSGDETLLKTIAKDLKEAAPDVEITALSANKKKTREECKINSVNRYNPFSVIFQIARADLLISGGGTLIQDATSTKSLLYYLFIIKLAERCNTRVMLYANGIGPVKDKNIARVARVLNGADVITLRESDSEKELARFGVTKPKIIVTADPAFNLEPADGLSADKIMQRLCVPNEKKMLGVSVREWKHLPKNFAEEMAESLDYIARKGYFPVLLPMQRTKDLKISKAIADKMREKSAVADFELSPEEMLALVGRCAAVCGMRLHTLIFASIMSRPTAGIIYDPKIKSFMDMSEQKHYIRANDFSAEKFTAMLDEITQNEKEISASLSKNKTELKKRAKENARIAAQLLKE